MITEFPAPYFCEVAVLAKYRQRCGDGVRDAFDIDLDNLLPILHPHSLGRNSNGRSFFSVAAADWPDCVELGKYFRRNL